MHPTAHSTSEPNRTRSSGRLRVGLARIGRVAGRVVPGALVGALVGVLGLLAMTSDALAQATSPAAWAVQSGADVTFQLLASAPFRGAYETERVRRFLDHNGQIVQVRERLKIEGDGTPTSPFKLEFLDLVGAGTAFDATARAGWSETYRVHAGLLHMHGGFSVHDPVSAAQNYRIYDYGRTTRAGRPTQQVVVFPNRLDKGFWLLDVDRETGVPLYSAEYDLRLRLLNELECTTFVRADNALTRGATAGTGPQKGSWYWTPRMRVTRYPTVQLAAASLTGLSAIQPAISGIVSEYHQSFVQVTEDPVNGDRTLVLGYTDGIDEFFVLQSPSSYNPLQSNPALSVKQKGGGSHTIAAYDDPLLRAYVFYQAGVAYRVFGRSSLERLKDVSMRLCRQAVTGV
ncbi:MAG: hypothetical protein AB7O97_12175 [Planctomycetota bacterium]